MFDWEKLSIVFVLGYSMKNLLVVGAETDDREDRM